MAIPAMYDPNKFGVPKAGYVPVPSVPNSLMSAPTQNVPQITANANAVASKTAPVTPAPQRTAFPSSETQRQPYSGIPMSSIGTSNVPAPQGVSNAVKSTIQAPTPTATPAPMSNWSTTPDQARQSAAQQAAIRIRELLQGGQNAFNTGTTSENNSFTYGNKITQGNRVLRDATNYAKSDPFQGSTMENNFRIQREDGINDTYTNDQHQNRINSISQTWQDLQTAAPEKQQALYDQLYQQAAALGIQADQLNAQLQNQQFNQGMQNKQFNQQQQQIDYNQNPNNPNNYGQSLTNQLNELKIGNYSTEQKQQAQLFEQQLKSGQMSNEAAAYNLQQLKDPKSAANQVKALDLQMKQIDAAGYSQENKLKLQQLQKQIAEIGVVHYKPQTQAEKDMDTQQLIKIKAEIVKLNNPTTKPAVVDPKSSTEAYTNYKDQIDASTYTKAQKLAFAASVKGEMTDSDYAKLVAGIQ